jgi:hypothetical protein
MCWSLSASHPPGSALTCAAGERPAWHGDRVEPPYACSPHRPQLHPRATAGSTGWWPRSCSPRSVTFTHQPNGLAFYRSVGLRPRQRAGRRTRACAHPWLRPSATGVGVPPLREMISSWPVSVAHGDPDGDQVASFDRRQSPSPCSAGAEERRASGTCVCLFYRCTFVPSDSARPKPEKARNI